MLTARAGTKINKDVSITSYDYYNSKIGMNVNLHKKQTQLLILQDMNKCKELLTHF